MYDVLQTFVYALEIVYSFLRDWSLSSTELQPFERSLPRCLPSDHKTPIRLWLKENIFSTELALLWFSPRREDFPEQRSSLVYRLRLQCRTTSAAATVRRLVPNTLEKLHLMTQDTPSFESLASFFRAAAECANKDSLNEVKIADHGPPHTRCQQYLAKKMSARQGNGIDPLFYNQSVTFGPLLWKVWTLDTLVIELDAVLDFSDGFLERLADACPRLTTLSLLGPPMQKRVGPLDRTPSMTLLALRILAEKCPKLYELCIELNATQIPDLNGAAWERQPSSELLELGVGMSPVATPEKVASILRKLFPDLNMLSPFEGSPFEGGDESSRIIGWQSVQKHLGIWPYQGEE